MSDYQRQPFDLKNYVQHIKTQRQAGQCFICDLAAGENPHHMVYEDDRAIVFLNKYPSLYGYTLVAPRQHLEQVTGNFPLEDYLALQTLIHQVAESIRAELQPERVYICSLGSQQANSHVHWHIAPLPLGVPFEKQQFQAMMIEKGVLDIPDEELVQFAARLAQRIQTLRGQ